MSGSEMLENENKELKGRIEILEKESKTLQNSLKILEEDRIMNKMKQKEETKTINIPR
jgi:hypothetical protein